MSEFMTQSGLATPFGWLFYLGAIGAVASALMMVLARSPLRAALWLIGSLCAVALLFLLLEAPFVAAMQVLVYAGAIMVLFVFVIMLLNLGPDASVRPAYLSVAKVLGALGAGYFTFQIIVSASGGAAMPVQSYLKKFRDEFVAHVERRGCWFPPFEMAPHGDSFWEDTPE